MTQFHPVVLLPSHAPVFDLTSGGDLQIPEGGYGIGRYNEKRPKLYNTELFSGTRYIHMGVDLFGPVDTPIHAPCDGIVSLFAYNPAPGDYGYTLIVEHCLDGAPIYALYGHLNAASIEGRSVGQKVRKGETIAWMGDHHENGGWPPHLHFQLCRDRPLVCDMPGVVSDEQYAAALERYPDPRIILGPLY